MDMINFIYDIISSPVSWLAGMLFLFGYTWTPKTETDEVIEEHINELQDKKVDKDADRIGAGGVINPFETVDVKGGIHLYDRDPQAIVTFTVDDGYARYDWPDLFVSKGITGTAFPAHHHMIGDIETWLALQVAGWEIGNHTKNHPHLDELTEEQIEDEVGDAKVVAEGWGFTIRNFAYPYGDYNDLVRKIVRKYHLGAATIKERVNMPPFRMDILHRVNGDADTLEQLKDWVDDAVNSASWMIVTLHAADAPKLTKIGDLINYIQSKNVQILTMTEAEDLIGNLVSSRYFNVGAKGEVSASLPPSPNLLDNSQFGVWSQSDAAKGLATINYITGDKGGGSAPNVGDAAVGDTSGAAGKIISYTIADGTWDGGNAEGVLTLGAVTGTFQDGETVTFEADQETCVVDGDKSIGILNDPMNNDDTGDWILDDCTLAFDTDHYEITKTAATQRIHQVVTLEKGKMYEIEFDYKDGTEAGVEFYAWFYDGAGYTGRIETSGVEWASYSVTFECGADTDVGQLGIMCNIAGAANVEVKNFSCYEITPCCTEGDDKAFDGWDKHAGIDIYREHNNEEATTKRGSFYALKYVSSGAGYRLTFPYSSDREEWCKQFRGRTVTFGMWVLTNTASHASLRIYDGVGSYSNVHTGGGDWEWLEVTVTVSTTNTNILFSLLGGATPNVDGSTIIYASQPKIMFGSSIGGGNYVPKQGEWMRCEKAIPLNTLHNKEGFSDVAWADLNIEAESEGIIPKGAKALLIGASVNDDGSAGGDCYLVLRKDDILGEQLYFSPYGLANDAIHRGEGIINLDVEGDLQYKIVATNGNFDIPRLKIYAVKVTD